MLVRIHPGCGHELYRMIRLGERLSRQQLTAACCVSTRFYFGKINLESVGCKAALVDLRLGGCPFF